jgi:hypothetical protein
MLFGMGMTLTPEEDALLADVVRPCYAALALANDYFSFDREWAEIQTNPVGGKPINAVWLYMQWRGVGTAVAKRLVTEAANRYERQFLELCEQFRSRHTPVSPKLDLYLRALSYQVSGNVVWSLNCPRYHTKFRYDPNAGVEDAMTAERRGETLARARDVEGNQDIDRHRQLSVSSTASSGSTDSDAHTAYSWDRSNSSSRCSSTSRPSTGDTESAQKKAFEIKLPTGDLLGPEVSTTCFPNSKTGQAAAAHKYIQHLEAPFSYVKSLPSKGVRDTLADAMNLWADLPEDTVTQIEEVVGDLHTASLMYVSHTQNNMGRTMTLTSRPRAGWTI